MAECMRAAQAAIDAAATAVTDQAKAEYLSIAVEALKLAHEMDSVFAGTLKDADTSAA